MDDADDFEEETIEGVVVDVRGPALDGTYEMDVQQPNGETVTVVISTEQYIELMSDVDDEEDGEKPNRLLN